MEGTGGNDHLALGLERLAHTVADRLDPDRTVPVEHDPFDEGAVLHGEVGPALRRVEERVGGAPTLPVPLRQLEPADPVLALSVEIGVRRVPRLDGRFEHRVDEGVHGTALGDGERPADAVVQALPSLVVLAALEVREHLRVAPAGAPTRGPVVVVEAIPAEVDHRVDRARAADHATPRVVEPPTAEPRLGLAQDVPVEARLEHDRERRRDADLGDGVRWAGFEQKHLDIRVLTQSRRQDAARGAGADDDVVSGHQTPLGRVNGDSLMPLASPITSK